MFEIPVQVALTWPAPNYDNPIIRTSTELWLLSAIFVTGATVCVACRMWSRVYVRRWFGLDDLFILIGYVSALCLTALVGVGTTHYNWDRHIWDMLPRNYEASMRTFYFCRIFWGLASTSVRVSVIFLYYRILKACQVRWQYFWVMHITTVFNFCILLYYVVTGVIPCWPIRAYWKFPVMHTAKCFDDRKFMQAAGVINTFAEFELAVLPLLAVYLLKVRSSQRLQILSLLSLGFLVTLVGCFRTYFIWKAWTTYDLTWYSAPQWACSEVENYLALMCACAVPLRPLVGRTVRRLDRKPSNQTSETSNSALGSIVDNQTDAGTEENGDWASILRKIDLEGIADDGYGYTITISGPRAGGKATSTSWLRTITSNFLSCRRREKKQRIDSQRLEMTMETEIIVDEHQRPLEQRGRWGSIASDSVDAITTKEADISLPQYLGDPDMMTPQTEKPHFAESGTCFPYPDATHRPS